MKRPKMTYTIKDGYELPVAFYEEIEANAELMRKLLSWRGLPSRGIKKCERCGFEAGSRKKFVVHHRHYRTFGNESPEDVCLLCLPCHTEIHDRADHFQLSLDDIPFVDPEWEEKIRRLPAQNKQTVLCPECKSPMILRNGKRGLFYGCTNYPPCRGNRKASYVPPPPKGESLEQMYAEFPLPLDGEQRRERRQRYGHLFPQWEATFRKSDGSEFIQRDNYADDEDAESNFSAQAEFCGYELLEFSKASE